MYKDTTYIEKRNEGQYIAKIKLLQGMFSNNNRCKLEINNKYI